MQTAKLEISKKLWCELILQLRISGGGENESGAFLLAKIGTNTISKFICYHELDPGCYRQKIIFFNSEGYSKLWKYCLENILTVVADIHTHPTNWTGQSDTDQNHPMILQKGHLAMIAPNYAKGNISSLRGVGLYEYQGDKKWKKIKYKSKRLLIR